MEFGAFMDANPTTYHFVEAIAEQLVENSYIELNERDLAVAEAGKNYFIRRNGTNIIAFKVGSAWTPGDDPISIVGSHIDANRICLKPSSTKPAKMGYMQLGAAAYGGGLNSTWWDRDLGAGGRVLIRKGRAVESRLVRLPGVIGSIPSLAPHFGDIAQENNKETNMVPVIGACDDVKPDPSEADAPLLGKHPLRFIRAIARELGVSMNNIIDWDLEFYSAEKAAVGGIDGSLLYCSRMDDRLCSYTAIQGLLQSEDLPHSVQVAALYDHEEVGSLSRTGAYGNLLTVVFDSLFADADQDKRYQSLAKSILISADVTHAGNPNYSSAYLDGHVPLLNTGMTIKQLGYFASDGVGQAICEAISKNAKMPLQIFSPRNDTRTGGTIGPMISAQTGVRTVDVGIPILSMHSIRELTGSKDVELGTRWFKSFYDVASEYQEAE